MGNYQNLAGKKFGQLTVIDVAGRGSNSQIFWQCHCSCGNKSQVATANLKNGHTKSCGCYGKSVATTHGQSGSKAYRSWQKMRSRCLNPNDTYFKNYGGRGIRICDRWQSFENFYVDMGDRPDERSLDRIDNNGNYTPENCRWATKKEQDRNKRNNRFITFNGRCLLLLEWAEELKINYSTLKKRLDRGWPIERALTEMPKNNARQIFKREVPKHAAI